MSGERQAATVERALAVLGALGSGPKAFSTLSAVAECGDAGLSRLLKGLLGAGLVTGGNGVVYRLTDRARRCGEAIVGQVDVETAIRDVLAALSDTLGTGCALFLIERNGVRCLYRHLVSEGVGFIAEGLVRTELCGHGSAVAGCAVSDDVAGWHAASLRGDLAMTLTAWRQRLGRIRRTGYDLSHGLEGAPRQGEGPLETLARLSIPWVGANGMVRVLTATGHGLSAERVYPDRAILAGCECAAQLQELMGGTSPH